MSDADNQMGGHGGDTGRDPADQSDAPPDPVKGNTSPGEDDEHQADKESKESFPASDPPANY